MGFNPLKEKGMPIEDQIQSWEHLNVEPYSPRDVDPYTRTRIILMNGIEVEGAIFGHQFSRHCDDVELKRRIALTRRVEQQQQKMVNWMLPAGESNLEITLGYEQVAVDLTAWLARTEPDPVVKDALDFALLEDFDHLYRYANLYELTEGKQASEIVGDYTEVFPGRPTAAEHRHPFDSVRRPYDAASADVLTKLHVQTITAGEQQTMNFYMTVGNRPDSMLGRGLYLEIAQIEEQHVSHYESLADPKATWLERLFLHEYNECWLYYSCLQQETNSKVKKHWQNHLDMEVEHVRIARELMKQYEGRDPADMYGELPELMIFQPNKQYVRDILAEQVDLTADGQDYVPVSDLSDEHRYWQYQAMVNSGMVPSEEVIDEHIDSRGRDYRLETEGEHPVDRFRVRDRRAA